MTTWALARNPVLTPPQVVGGPGILTTFFTSIGNAVGGVIGPILIGVLFPTATSSPDTIGSQPYLSPEYIEANCELVNEVIEPTTSFPGGQSIEQEYLCPNGMTYFIHILRTKTGIVRDKHYRGYSRTKGPNAVQKPTGVKEPATGANQ